MFVEAHSTQWRILYTSTISYHIKLLNATLFKIKTCAGIVMKKIIEASVIQEVIILARRRDLKLHATIFLIQAVAQLQLIDFKY